MMKKSLLRSVLVACACLLAACAAGPVASPVAAPSAPPPDVNAMYAAVQIAGRNDDRELAVQPLRDPQVEDLREHAASALSRRDLAAAADALNQALLIVADDPAILQERAEVALLATDLTRAETLSQRAIDLGSAAGPLCRRHWETLRQVREYRLDSMRQPDSKSTAEDVARLAGQAAALAAKVAEAAGGRDACTVAGFDRM